MATRARARGFSLLEVLIAMSILAVGAASILSIFVWAVSFYHKRTEENRLSELYNHVLAHARAAWDAFDPATVPEGQPRLPKRIEADLTPENRSHADLMIAEAARKFPGYRYLIAFEENDLAVSGSSVVVDIEIRGLSGQRDEFFSHKEILSRTSAPPSERFRSPSLEKQQGGRAPRRRP